MNRRQVAQLALVLSSALVLGGCGAATTASTTNTTTDKATTTSTAATASTTTSSPRTNRGVWAGVETASKQIDERTHFAIVTPNGIIATENAKEPVAGLSIMKMFVADYALMKGDHSPEDFALSKRMILYSDDFAADQLYSKYPNSIDSVAAEHNLTSTYDAGYWGNSITSAHDVAVYIDRVRKARPNSFIQRWMREAPDFAADGTHQTWGTAQLPGALGSKWGWSDTGTNAVASATLGTNWSAAAFTTGSAERQNADLAPIAKAMPK